MSEPSSDREPVVVRRPWGSMEITEHGEGEDRYYETKIRKRDYDPGELAERVGMDGDEPPPVPAHVWPEWNDLVHTEHRHGFVWCRRCGRVLTGRSGIRRDMKPCRVVPITTRAGIAGADERLS